MQFGAGICHLLAGDRDGPLALPKAAAEVYLNDPDDCLIRADVRPKVEEIADPTCVYMAHQLEVG